MNRPSQNPAISMQPYVRPSPIEWEPAAFALSVIAVVMSISLWNPLPKAEQVAPADASHTVAQAPGR